MRDQGNEPGGPGDKAHKWFGDEKLANLVDELTEATSALTLDEVVARITAERGGTTCLVETGQEEAGCSPMLMIRLDDLERLITRYLALNSYQSMSERMRATADLPAASPLVLQLEKRDAVPSLRLETVDTSDAS